ncbi:aspartyl-tRNA(Asn)/glutamyl-tRNA(Gln) amidotransferase subunit B [Polynucleobacter sphagniphilus]|jgi:aspartyl-tRNA(Asn)/glutamyl-tRNA(Gln) amidotransferase subunit B|nr:aspartyl-tRNA(Asn)/glutamyl-tRNA(Gln) amidotransferase subunit B [Polynucleobacter sphagniphilus]MDH6248934.1 aspartyl-tRNA(Asn)/glutamyl-tRNA(Gln) amidotransferase subunit B [Polynucleobacter sphagniphilus]MDH6299558.1 aspartyl-tRNA(Asn)/glutamyl-tRNA(Gln) amidotransferase subunit B [Polynucleobacter sphagniphilus]MDH6421393.1 aspartyl-tRNA(Asn)/glutamyl-tRNA(Gln) amidotransferase subunit B [Polynucleobacter sphagniphilus]MDH6524701.1 aspartyl-tRNA(Asn)/glutamyl-tRNA(Gln) amidotransferase s
MMQWEVVIGLETHAQLQTQSKIFSGASTRFGAQPNTQACAVDLALPGVLPVLNRQAVEHAIRFGLAVGAKISPASIFARKNYFYPDLPKGYQISQFEIPVVVGGQLEILVGDEVKVVELTRAHMEEDAGKSVHEEGFTGPHGEASSGIDLNRAGTPLLEIVTEPVMRSAVEAVAYAKALHGLVVWLGVCDGNMQEGSFRCDANVSVRPKGQVEFGTRCEIKNLNSFRFLEEAIQYEVRRQIELIEDGGTVVQETRLYDPDKQETRSMRSKEDANDYRYFPDPDLLPVVIDQAWIADVRSQMPALPAQLRERWQRDFGLSAYDAQLLTQDRDTAKLFETLLTLVDKSLAKAAANLITGEFASALNRAGMATADAPLKAEHLAPILARIADGTISNKIAKDIFAILWEDVVAGKPLSSVDEIIEAKGLKQISDSGALEAMIDQVLVANQKSVEEFRSGKEKAFNALVGQIMKASQGKANPGQVNELLRKKLS